MRSGAFDTHPRYAHASPQRVTRAWRYRWRASDLYIEPDAATGLAERLRCKRAIADALDLNVDLIVQQPGSILFALSTKCLIFLNIRDAFAYRGWPP